MGLRVQCILQPVADLCLELRVIGVIEHRRRKGALRFAGLGNQFINRSHNLFDLAVSKLDRGQDHLFGFLFCARLDHHDAVLVADYHDVHCRRGALRVGGIHHKLAVHASHAHRAHRRAKRNVGERQSRGRAIDADHIGVVFLVGGKNQRNQLRFIAKSIREERAQRPIDLATRQNLLFAGPALALDKSAGNASAGVGVLAVIHREREEIDAFPRVG